jgi:4-amino-4-deoxy-L-arabinose transferase-like glycosyltransferase
MSRTLGSLFVLALLLLFAFPLKIGTKVDPAIYAALARDVAEGVALWPLSFPDLFDVFQEHPPLSLWMMGLFMKVFGSSMLVASIYSRLCALASFGILLWMVQRASREDADSVRENRLILAGLLLLSWIPWLKYVGAAQLEGPFGLAVTGAFALMFWSATQTLRRRIYALALLVGAFGFLSKGILFVPIVLICLLWGWTLSPLKPQARRISSLILTGAVLGAMGMLGLDHLGHTHWSQYYWSRALGWGFQGENQFNPSMGTSFADLMVRGLVTLKSEIQFSPLWTPFLWVSMVVFAIGKPSLRSPLFFAVLFYWAFMSPFMISKIKMPHWPVPVYPIASFFVVMVWKRLSVDNAFWVGMKKHFPKIVLGLGVLLATLPYPLESRHGRGEEWVFHRAALQKKIDANNPLLVIQDQLPMFMVLGYSHWYWGRSMPRSYLGLQDFLNRAPCKSEEFAWMENSLAQSHSAQLESKGWRQSLHQHRNITLLECTRTNPAN